MNRISRPHMFMKVAEVVSLRSTCFRRSVGAILVYDNNIISIGFNGAPSGEPHCSGKTCPTSNGCKRAIHAEYNAIQRCGLVPPWGEIDLYTTESPCYLCAELICSKKIRAVYFQHEYRIREGITTLLQRGVAVYRLTPSGYIINCATEEMEEAL